MFQGKSPWTLEKKFEPFCLKVASYQWNPDHRHPRKEAETWWRELPHGWGESFPGHTRLRPGGESYPMDGGKVFQDTPG